MKKNDIVKLTTAIALILAITNMYILYNTMSEIDNMYHKLLTVEQSVEHIRNEIKGEFWNLTRYNFIITPTSEMEIHAIRDVEDGVAYFRYNGDMAIFNVTLPLNTTYRLDIYAWSDIQTQITRGSALEVLVDEQLWGIVTFTAEEWNWEHLGSEQMYAGRHEIKLILREGIQLGDTNIDFTRVRILWLKN